MKSTIKITQTASDKLIHKSLRHIASIVGRQELDVTFETLAKECNVPLEDFLYHFKTMDQLLSMAIQRMTKLFIQRVQIPVKDFPLENKNKNKVWYFLRCTEDYLKQFPEAGYLFTMTFFSDIAVSDMYHLLEDYYGVWEETLYGCLSEIISLKIAKRLTNIYFISLKGQLQLADYETIPKNSYHAENFLKEALYNI